MSSQVDEVENATFQVLAHPIRRRIIRIAQSREQGVTYSELLSELELSTGKLNYHLEQLTGILEKNINNAYVLSPFGRKVVEHLNLIEQRTSSEDEKYVATASLSHKTSLQPVIKSFLTIGILMSAVIVSIWTFLFYITLTNGAPAFVYVLLPILIAIGSGLIGSLIYTLAKAPLWIKRFERRYFGETTEN